VDVVSRLRAAGCVFAEEEARLLRDAASEPDALAALVARRVAGEPLEYVLGWAEFHGLRLAIEPGVFVPRHRTEFLADQAAALARPGAVVVDLCCGCGAVGAAVAAAVPVELHAADVSPAAVRAARRNVARVYEGDLFTPLPAELRGRVEVLVANVPYVPTDAIAMMPPEARDHEPREALDGGGDGLDVLRRVAARARDWLAPGGHLLVETGRRQAALAVSVMADARLDARAVSAEGEEATVVIGRARVGG
jgi:release factor glutamine methyltransferase